MEYSYAKHHAMSTNSWDAWQAIIRIALRRKK